MVSNKGVVAGVVPVETQARQLRCLELAVAGLSYTAIAEEEGYASESGARAAVNAVLQRTAVQGAEELRLLLGEQLADLYRRGMLLMEQGAENGNLDMVKAGALICDRALGRRMRLYGLDTAVVGVGAAGGDPGRLEALRAKFAEAWDARDGVQVESVTESLSAPGEAIEP